MTCKTRLMIAASVAVLGGGVYWALTPQSEAQYIEVRKDLTTMDPIRPIDVPRDLDLAKARLGRSLFMDPRLSHNNQISCHSCHDFARGGSDNRRFSIGINGAIGGINAPTVFNSGFNFKQFWNGRAGDLVEQAGKPVENPIEMGSSWSEVVGKLNDDAQMRRQFSAAFHQRPSANTISEALAEFERALVTTDAPFDRYLRGDKTALSESQIRGYKRFTEYGCVSCHQGQNVGGNMFQQMGVAHDYFRERGGHLDADDGRFSVTKSLSDLHVFKVPSLRNVELTAPYFHDGTEPTLEGAVRKMARYQVGRVLPDGDVHDIVQFLKSLTGEMPAILKDEEHGIAAQ